MQAHFSPRPSFWRALAFLSLLAAPPLGNTTQQLPFVAWNTFFGVEGTSYWDIARDLATDPQGNIYVVGRSDGTWGDPIVPYEGYWGFWAVSDSTFVAKFDPAGNLLWSTFLGDILSGDMQVPFYQPLFIAWSPAQRVCVAGGGEEGGFVACLGGNGGKLWEKTIESADGGLAAGADGTLYVAGDGLVQAFDRNGDLLWRTFVGGAGYDFIGGIALGSNGDILIAGSSEEEWGDPVRPYTGGEDIFVARLDQGGHLLWNTFLGGERDEWGTAITEDPQGNLFVAAEGWPTTPWGNPVAPPIPQDEGQIAKLDGSGRLIWNRFLQMNSVEALAADESGAVWAGGFSFEPWGDPIEPFGGALDESPTLVRLGGDGTLLWNTFVGAGSIHGIQLDRDGTLLAAGESDVGFGESIRPFTDGADGFLVRFDGSGHRLWNTFVGGGGSIERGDERTGGMARDDAGNLYITGASYGDWGNPLVPHHGGPGPYDGALDAFVAKFDPQGNLLWNTFLGSQGHDEGVAVEIAADGALWVVGISGLTWGAPIHPHGEKSDIFIARLDGGGHLLWNTFFGGEWNVFAEGAALDAQGNLYIAGHDNSYRDSAWTNVGLLAKLDPQGTTLWETRFDAAPSNFVRDVALNGTNQPVVIGHEGHGSNARDTSFVARLDDSGELVWKRPVDGILSGIATGGGEATYVLGTGGTSWGSPVRPWSGGKDAYVAAFDANGELRWNTFLGAPPGESSSWDEGMGLVWTGGDLLATGFSTSRWGEPIDPGANERATFLARLDPATGDLRWNLFLNAYVSQTGLVGGADGRAYFYGTSRSTWGDPIAPYRGGPERDAALAAILPIWGAIPIPLDSGGSISPEKAQWRAEGQSVQFTITPDPGYGIATITGCEGTRSGLAFVTAPLTQDCTLSVAFEKDPPPPAIHATYDGNGSATLLFTPNDGGVASYAARCLPDGGGAEVVATAIGSPLVIAGLTNGVAYSCTLQVTGSAQVSAPFTLAPSATATGRPTPVPALGLPVLLWLSVLLGLAAGAAGRKSIRL